MKILDHTFIIFCIFIFFLSFLTTFLLTKSKFINSKFGTSRNNNLHNFHDFKNLRIGGFSIIIVLFIACILFYLLDNTLYQSIFFKLLAASIPTFCFGFWDDISEGIDPYLRIIGSLLSSIIALLLFKSINEFLHLSNINNLFIYLLLSSLLILYIVGMIHSYNLIDGLNGLAIMVGISSLSSILFIAIQLNDFELIFASSIILSCLLGFFLLNYPFGKIFLGDGGAYFLGFSISILSILLASRNDRVSFFYPLLINIYPFVETIFTIWRRAFRRRKSIFKADRLHLHSIIYKNIKNKKFFTFFKKLPSNSKSSPILWLINLIPVIISTCYNDNGFIIFLGCFLYIFIYLYLYKFFLNYKY